MRLLRWMTLATLAGATPLTAQVREQVTVVNRDIRVHVVDRDGRPVRGLGRDDFAIREDDAAIALGYFEEIDLAAPPLHAATTDSGEPQTETGADDAPGPASLLLVIDSGSMSPPAFKNGVKALRQFVREAWDGRRPLKIVQIEERMAHLTELTRDKDQVLAALDSVKRKGLLWRQLEALERDIVDNVLLFLQWPAHRRQAAATQINHGVRQKALAKERAYRAFFLNMSLFAAYLEGLPGHKSVFLLTGGGYLENGIQHKDTADWAQQLNLALNRANVTLYAVLAKAMQTPAERRLMIAGDGALPPNPYGLTENRLQSLSYFPLDAFDPDAGVVETVETPAMNTVFENRRQQESAPRAATDGTGGMLQTSGRADVFTRELGGLYAASNHYYRLGYSRLLAEIRPDAAVKIEVRDAKVNRWRVRYGRKIGKPKALAAMTAEERALDFEAKLMFGLTRRNDLDCQWGFGLFPDPQGGAQIAVYARLPAAAFPEAGYEIGFAALDRLGSPLAAVKSLFRGGPDHRPALIYDTLATAETPAALHSFVRDIDSGKTSFHRQALAPDALTPPLITPLILAADPEELTLPLRDDAPAADRAADPFKLGPLLFRPRAGARFHAPAQIGFLFTLYDPQTASKAFRSRIALEGEKAVLPGVLERLDMPGPGVYRFFGRVDTAGLAPGEYRLTVKIADPQTKRTHRQSATVKIDR